MIEMFLTLTLIMAQGWRLSVSESARVGQEEALTSYEVIISGERARISGDMGDFIIDIPGNRIYLTDNVRKIYTELDLKAWSETVEKVKGAMSMDTTASVEVVRSQDTATILGGNAVLYKVLINGKPEEEIWVREDLKADEFLTFEKALGKIFGRSFIREKIENELRKLTSGLPVLTRTVSESGEVYTSKIEKAEKIRIKEKELSPPPHYRRVSPEVFFQERGD